MPDIKTKKPAKRKGGNSPVPCGPGSSCGHSGCEDVCRVRYVGPTSHPRDHHAQEAAHGAKHVWTAAIVAGLAVVLTGAIAYSAVEAQTPQVNLNALNRRLEKIEQAVQNISNQLFADQESGEKAAVATEQSVGTCESGCHEKAINLAETGDELDRCLNSCKKDDTDVAE